MNKTPKDWLVVVDDLNSAIGIAASNRFGEGHNRIIAANEFRSFNALLSQIASSDCLGILFSWRSALDLPPVSKRALRNFREKTSSKLVFMSIVDHLPLYTNRLGFSALDLTDFYFVCNRQLLNEHSRNLGSPKLIGLLHDLPKYDELLRLGKSGAWRQPKSIIWVGNSEWGRHQGFFDHKGFHGIVKPLFKRLEDELGFKCTIIDSAEKRLPNNKVLFLISSSEILIQASNSEGTGLPCLEAVGLGTNVLTTDVGIVPELRFPALNIFSREDSLDCLVRKVEELSNSTSYPTIDIHKYVSMGLRELPDLNLLKKNSIPVEYEKHLGKSIYLTLKWKRRWVLKTWVRFCKFK
jgi:hypothetical protein